MALDSFELEINRFLRAGRPIEEVARQLRDLWDRGGLSHYDQNVIALFLARSGQIEPLFHIAQNAIEKETRVPWLAVLEAFRINQTALTKTVLNQIFVGCGVEDRLEDIALATDGDVFDPRFFKLRQQAWEEQKKIQSEELERAMEKLALLRADRLFEAEEKLLDRLYLQFPDNPRLIQEFRELEGRRARGVLQRRHRDVRHSRLIEELVDPLGDEKLDEFDRRWTSAIVAQALLSPRLAYDFAIALIQMGLPQPAMQALHAAPASSERDSLLLDLMVETRNFIQALQFADEFEARYSDRTESAFAAIYARARSLWGLSQKKEAIHLLEGLLKLRPTYRSAQALLMDWKEADL